MPDPYALLASWFASTLPAYDLGTPARIAADLPDPVLWGGRAYPESAVAQACQYAAVSAIAAAAFALLFLGCLRALDRMREATDGKLAVRTTAISLFGSGMGFVLALLVGCTEYGFAYSAAPRSVVVTATRIVAMAGDGTRQDIPASAVTGIQRSQDGSVVVGRVGWRAPSFQVAQEDSASLDRAIERMASAGWGPNQFVSRLGERG